MTASASKTIPGYTTLKNHAGQDLFIKTEEYTLINALLDQGSNLFLIGPAGVAKTELAEAILLERGLKVFQLETGAISSGDQLDGERSLDNDGKLINLPSELLKAVKSAAGGTATGVILDELNRVASPAAVNKLLRLYSGKREYASDLDGILHVGTHLQTIATANIGYHGTVKLNQALLDRFDVIEIGAITGRVLEVMLEARFPAAALGDIKKIVSFSDSVAKAAEREPDGDLQPISVRDAQRIVRGITAGLTPMEAITKLVGGQLTIQQRGAEAIEALVSQAKGKFA